MNNLTPLKAIRARCIDCSGFQLNEVRECQFDGISDKLCPLYRLRMGKGSRSTLKHIRSYCLWCCNNQKYEVRLCPAVRCPLWVYRFGKRPKISLKHPLLLEILMTDGVSADKVCSEGVGISSVSTRDGSGTVNEFLKEMGIEDRA